MTRCLILYAAEVSDAAPGATEFAVELVRETSGEHLEVRVQQAHASAPTPTGLAELERVEHVRVARADILHATAARWRSQCTRIRRADPPEPGGKGGIPPAGLSMRREIAAPASS